MDDKTVDYKERFDCWVDGDSVQIIAVTSHGDPIDCSSNEARDFALKILKAVDEVDQS